MKRGGNRRESDKEGNQSKDTKRNQIKIKKKKKTKTLDEKMRGNQREP